MSQERRILVIEDAHALRKDIVEMLQFEGFEVFGAENGEVGVRKARELQPNLIICDIMMPVLDGFGVLDAIQQDRVLATTPFIFLTARTDRMDVRHAMEHGADDFLTKPFTAAELIKTVHARLHKMAVLEGEATQQIEKLRNNIVMALPHELRTPLHVILGYAELLTSEGEMMQQVEGRQVAEWSRHIHKAGTRLYHLIENFIVYAQTEIAQSDVDERRVLSDGQSFYPRSAIETYAAERATNQSRQPNRRSDLHLHLEDTETIAISEEFLKKLVEEIADNAFKFSEPGTPVVITSSAGNGWYTLRFTDHGRGMSKEEIADIGAYMQFERRVFEQQGAGLGLIICHRLVQLNRGTIEVESEPGAGTTVTLRLPLHRASSPPPATLPQAAHSEHAAGTAPNKLREASV